MLHHIENKFAKPPLPSDDFTQTQTLDTAVDEVSHASDMAHRQGAETSISRILCHAAGRRFAFE